MKPYREARILRQRIKIFLLSFPVLFICVGMLTAYLWRSRHVAELAAAIFSGVCYIYILALAFLSKPKDFGE